MEQLYNQSLNIIKSTSWKIANKYGVDYNDVFSHGNMIFCECAKRHNARLGDFTNYLLTSMWNSISKYVKKNYLRESLSDNIGIIVDSRLKHTDDTIKKVEFQEKVDALDEDCKKIINLIVNDNLCFFNKRITKSLLKEELKNRYSWPNCKIEYYFSQISNIL